MHEPRLEKFESIEGHRIVLPDYHNNLPSKAVESYVGSDRSKSMQVAVLLLFYLFRRWRRHRCFLILEAEYKILKLEKTHTFAK